MLKICQERNEHDRQRLESDTALTSIIIIITTTIIIVSHTAVACK